MPLNEVPEEDVLKLDEGRAQFVFIEKAFRARRKDIRRRALLDGFMHFGLRFYYYVGYVAAQANHAQPFEDLSKESFEILTSWMLGHRLTQSEEEDERRAEMATSLLKDEGQGLQRLAARCIMALPEGHPRRDVELVRKTLLKYLERVRANGEPDDQIITIHDLISFELQPHEQILALIQEGTELLPRVTETEFRHDFYVCVIGYYVSLAIVERDKPDAAAQKQWSERAKEVLDRMRTDHPETFQNPGGLKLAGLVLELNEQYEEAASAFAAAADQADSHKSHDELAAMIEARSRVGSKEFERIVKILTPIVADLEKKYLLAVNDLEISDAGNSFSEVVRTLAFAHAQLGQWAEAVSYLERGKSLRLRYLAALRRIPRGKRLLKLERQLYALERGVPIAAGEFEKEKSQDWLGAGVSLKTKILETYRTGRPKNPFELLASPSIEDVARSLGPREALVTIGVDGRCGTLMAVVCAGDSEKPAAHFLWDDKTLESWIHAFGGDHENGWLYALGAPEIKVDAKNALTMLLSEIDKTIGQTLNEFLKQRRITGITIVPHLWFHLVPFWALPSLASYDISMAASVGHHMQSRAAKFVKHSKALVVADPTGDLRGSLAEADFVQEHLAQLGYDVQRLAQETATEDSLLKGLQGVSILHFCGHGRSDFDRPMRSALLVYPDLSGFETLDGDPFTPIVARADSWQAEDEDERSTLIPDFGRLYEKQVGADTIERRIEYGERGTLWGRYRNGVRSHLAEMWSAGDILAEGSLKDCRFVFLSACEAGGSGMTSDRDEYSGLAAALQVSGASTIICSLWPVSDGLTALYVDLFYAALARKGKSANVVSIARKTGLRLRDMRRKRAAYLLRRLSGRTSSSKAGYILEAYAMQIEKGSEFPFSHPYDWAAFFVTGNSNWDLPQELES